MVDARAFVLECARCDTPDDPYAFELGAQDYVLRTPGGGREIFTIAWNTELREDLTALRHDRCDPVIVQRVGERLRRALQPTGWPQVARDIAAAIASDAAVQLTIRANAAELYTLPWELLTLDESGIALGGYANVLLRYAWPETSSKPRPPGDRPGRILVAWSEAGGPVPDVEHVAAIEQACREGSVEFSRSRDVLTHVSTASLVERLERQTTGDDPYVILHLLCHGTAIGSGFGLLLDGDDGPVAVDAGRLRQLLAPFATNLRLVVLSACDSGNAGEPGNRLGSVAQALHRGGIAAVIGSRYPLSIAGSVALTSELYRHLLVELTSVETAICQLRTRLSRAAGRFDWASLQLYARPEDGGDTRPVVFRPYRGLLAFEAEHARFFFGRDAEVSEVIDDLLRLSVAGRPRFLVVAGASGTGKSSVVLAGAVPRLAQVDEPRTAVVMRPGDSPMAALEQALRQRGPQTQHFLLVVDQFEEIFTHTKDAGLRDRFLRRLWSLACGPSGIEVIATIRVDFVGRCGEVAVDQAGTRLDRIAYDEDHRVFVAQMAPAQLRETIERPAARVGLRLEAGLADRILEDTGGEPGALPLMEYALDRLWLARDGRVLTSSVYTQMGGVIGALGSKADGIIDALSAAEQAQARRLLTQLVTFADDEDANTRKRRRLTSLRPSEPASQVLFDGVVAQLVAARLLVQGEEVDPKTGREVTLEIAHEALIRKWQRLRTWLKQDREKLVELDKLAGWTAEYRSDGRLLFGTSLGYARDVISRYPDDVDADTRELVSRSQGRMQKLIGAGVVGGFVVVVLCIVATALWREARQNAKIARKNEIAAKASEGAAKSIAEIAEDRALLARDSVRVSAYRYLSGHYLPSAGLGFLREVETPTPLQKFRGWGVSAWGALQPPTRQKNLYINTVHGQEFDVSYSTDGQLIAAGASDRSIRLWRANTGELVYSQTMPADANARPSVAAPTRVVFRGDSRALLAYAEHTVQVIDVDTNSLAQTWQTPAAILTAGYCCGENRIIVSDRRGQVTLWDPLTGLAVSQFDGYRPVGGDFVGGRNKPLNNLESGERHRKIRGGELLQTDPLGRYAASYDGRHLSLWELAGGTLRERVLVTTQLEHLVFSPSGMLLYAAGETGVLELEVASGAHEWLALDWHAPPAISADGGWALAATPNGMQVQDLRAGRLIATLPDVTSAAWHPDSDRFVTGSRTGVATWRMDIGAPVVSLRVRKPVTFARFNRDGSRVLTHAQGQTTVWNRATQTPIFTTGPAQLRPCAAFSPDGNFLVDCTYNHAVIDAHTGRVVHELGTRELAAVAFSPDGRRVATLGIRGGIQVFTNTGEPVSELATEALTSLAFSADSQRLIAADRMHRLFAWELASGRAIEVAIGHEDVELPGFTHDLRRYLASDVLDVMRIYDSETGEPKVTLGSHDDVTTSVAFARDDSRVVTGSDDHSVRVWDAATGEATAVFFGHRAGVESVAFAPGDTVVLTAGGDGVVNFWELGRDLTGERMIQLLWGATPLCPSVEDRVELLSIPEVEARTQDFLCRTMVECIAADSSKFAECHATFQDQQTHELRASAMATLATVELDL